MQLFSQTFGNQYNSINQPSSLPLELTDRFLYEAKIGYISLCKAKVPVMRVGFRAPAISKMEFFVAINKIWKLSNIVPKTYILDRGYEKRKSISVILWYMEASIYNFKILKNYLGRNSYLTKFIKKWNSFKAKFWTNCYSRRYESR